MLLGARQCHPAPALHVFQTGINSDGDYTVTLASQDHLCAFPIFFFFKCSAVEQPASQGCSSGALACRLVNSTTFEEEEEEWKST